MEVILERNKETKNTIRFQGETEDTQYLNIYLPKDEVAEMGNPDRLKLTIEPAE